MKLVKRLVLLALNHRFVISRSCSTKRVTCLKKFIESSKQCVTFEKLAEEERTKILIETKSVEDLTTAGFAVGRLKFVDYHTSPDGRFIVRFRQFSDEKQAAILSSKNIRFSPGDPIALCPEDDLKNPISRGVVYKLNDKNDPHISLCFNEWREEQTTKIKNKIVCFTQSSDNFTYEKLLHRIAHFTNDESKNRVVDFCINDQRPICFIHGPPGTGKTTCLAKIVEILIQNGKKVLACAPSNAAVDNMIEKFAALGLDSIRLGHPIRTFANLRDNCLDYRLQSSDRQNEIEDVRNALDKLVRQRPNKGAKKEKLNKFYNKMKFLKTKLWFESDMALREMSSSTNLVCCTLTSAIQNTTPSEKDSFSTNAGFLSKFTHFDCVVIDECTQATELTCWGALLRGKRCILAGDPNQLSATVLSEKAKEQGYDKSIMQRMVDEFPKKFVNDQMLKILTTQFRMHEFIMRWSSENMYGNILKAADCVSGHLLCDLDDVRKAPETSSPLVFLDTSDAAMYEISSSDDQSKANLGEVALVRAYVKTLINLGVKQEDIAVIAPYNLQVHHLRQRILVEFPDISINSIDAFQGQEKEAVILSLVRSNKHGSLGFLTDYRRINVAVTRARRQLIIVGNADCIARNDQTMKSLVDHCRKFGVFKSMGLLMSGKNNDESELINNISVDSVQPRLDLKSILGAGA
uniref:Helicase ATP-binding domain-containing protein n=1 Tax=Romanomermis culicivorax TaxID=13658 RepID=A0A915IKT6_ROMCU